MKKFNKLIIGLSLFIFGSVFFLPNATYAITTEEARQILSTGRNPEGTTATLTELQEANRVYYGSFYINQPSVTAAGSANNQESGTVSGGAVCTGDPRLSAADALHCAQIAEQEGRARGLNVQCDVSITTYPSTGPATGPGYYYNTPCTINGIGAGEALFLAGYDGTALTTPHLNPTWYMYDGTFPQGYISGGSGGQLISPALHSSGNTSSSVTGGTQGSSLNVLLNAIQQANNTLSSLNSNTTSSGTSGGGASGGSGATNVSTSQLGVLLESIRQALSALSSITANTPGSANTSQTPQNQNCAVRVISERLNVRSGPSTAASIVRQMSAGQTFTASGSVTGDTVEGSNKWWQTSDGKFIWAGGTVSSCSLGNSGNTGGTGSSSPGGTSVFRSCPTALTAIPSNTLVPRLTASPSDPQLGPGGARYEDFLKTQINNLPSKWSSYVISGGTLRVVTYQEIEKSLLDQASSPFDPRVRAAYEAEWRTFLGQDGIRQALNNAVNIISNGYRQFGKVTVSDIPPSGGIGVPIVRWVPAINNYQWLPGFSIDDFKSRGGSITPYLPVCAGN